MLNCCPLQTKISAIFYEHQRLLKTTEIMGEHLRPRGALSALQALERSASHHDSFPLFLELSSSYRQLYSGLRYTATGNREHLPQAAKYVIEDSLRAVTYLELELKHELSRTAFSDEELVHRLLQGSSTS